MLKSCSLQPLILLTHNNKTHIMNTPTLPLTPETLATTASLFRVSPLTVYDPVSSDRAIAAEFAASRNISTAQLSGQKRLLPRDLFNGLRSLMSDFTKSMKAVSSPWEDGGMRIIKCEFIPEFIDTYTAFESKWNKEIDAIIPQWDAVRDASRALLGSAFEESRFPSSFTVRRHLSLSLEFRPVPVAGDFRVDVPALAIRTLNEGFEVRLDQQKDSLRYELLNVVDTIKRKMEAWTDGKSRFHETTLSNILDAVSRIPKVMLEPDAVLIAAVEEARNSFSAITAEDIRDCPDMRSTVASRAAAILESMKL